MSNVKQEHAYDWTIMLYLSGDNSLSEDMIRTLNEIADQGAPKRVAITIQYDSSAAGRPTFRYALAGGNGLPVKEAAQLEFAASVEAEIGPFPIARHLIETLENENSADPKVLADFIRWSAKTFDSTYRMLILSGHGSGAVGDFLTDNNVGSGQAGSLTIPQLRTALELAKTGEGKPRRCAEPFSHAELGSGGEPRLLHVLGMDSCLMGTAEVCHEVREHVGYLVGSEGFVPNAGWPYAHLLAELRQRCAMKSPIEPEELAGSIVRDVVSYYESHLPAGVSIDVAACRLDKLENLTVALAALVRALEPLLKHPLVRDMVVTAHWRAQSYKLEQHTDLWDFCIELKRAAERFEIKELQDISALCQLVADAVDAVVEGRQDFCGPEFQHSHGLSVYYPWSASDQGALKPYAKLAFSKDTASGWSGFLSAYSKRTQREPRVDPPSATQDPKVAAAKDASTWGAGLSADGVATTAGTHKFAEGTSKFAEGTNKFAEGTNKFAEGTNKFSEGTNKFAEGTNKFVMRLMSGQGTNLPWSMKNPPTRVRIRRPVEASISDRQPAKDSTDQPKPRRKKRVTRRSNKRPEKRA